MASDTDTIAPKSATGLTVSKGDILRVTDLEGSQVADFVCFDADNYRHAFSQSRTRHNNPSVRITSGDLLFSNTNRPMFRIVADTVGVHDLLYPACNAFIYETIFNVGPQNGCAENLAGALEPFGIEPLAVPDPFNIFMHTDIDADKTMVIKPPRSNAGDYMELEAQIDCLVAITSCAEDISECNGGKCTPIGISVRTP